MTNVLSIFSVHVNNKDYYTFVIDNYYYVICLVAYRTINNAQSKVLRYY